MTEERRLLPLATRYILMTTEQAPPALIAVWLQDPLFARYVARERKRA
jgi:hypothetical protein